MFPLNLPEAEAAEGVGDHENTHRSVHPKKLEKC